MKISERIDDLRKRYKQDIREYRLDINTYTDNFALEEKGAMETLQRVVKDVNKLYNILQGEQQ